MKDQTSATKQVIKQAMKLGLGAMALGVCVAAQAAAPVLRAPIITSFSRDGVLACTNLVPGTVASVEGMALSVPADPWTNVAGLDSVTVDANGMIQVSVPISQDMIDEVMCYRVLGVPPVVADFTGSPTSGVAPLTAYFTNLSSGATNYSWDFGDGKSSAGVNPANTYTNAGSYTVSLTAIGAGGTNSLTRTSYIVATNPPPGMVMIPAGSFTMGATTNMGHEYYTSEVPQHTVDVSAFYMDKYEVTKALWDEVATWGGGNGYGFEHAASGKAADHPVMGIDWYEMMQWCNARSQKAGLVPCYYNEAGLTTIYKSGKTRPYPKWDANGYRLPTEAEWEKAARGGLSGQRFPWGNTISESQANYYAYPDPPNSGGYTYDVATYSGHNTNYNTGGYPYTSPVGSFAPNGYGLYDMAGNLWELCWDWYQSNWYSQAGATQSDTRGPTEYLGYCVGRGGAWNSDANGVRCALRSVGNPLISNRYDIGFRCVRGL